MNPAWRWIVAGNGSQLDMDWWLEVESWETNDNQSPFPYEATKLQSSAELQTYGVLTAWPHPVQYWTLFRDANYAATCLSFNAEYDPESYPESQLQCRYRTSRTRLVFGGATIFKEGDDRAGFAKTPTANYHTGSAGTKHCGTHSPIEKASNGEKCIQRSDGKHTYRWIKKPHVQVTIPNEIPTQSRRSQLSLGDPNSVSAIPTQSRRSRLSLGDPDSVSAIPTHSGRSRLSLGEPDPVSTIPRNTAATGNPLQNQS